MDRRPLLSSLVSGGTLLIAGCLARITEPPGEGHLRIYNRMDSEVFINVRIKDEDSYIVYSENHTLSPEGIDGHFVEDSPGTEVGNTYVIDVESVDSNKSYEWEITDGTGVLSIEVKDMEIEFSSFPFED